MTRPLSLEDFTPIQRKVDSKLITTIDFSELPAALECRCPVVLDQYTGEPWEYNGNWFNLHKNGDYNYHGGWASYYSSISVNVRLVHFVDSGHLGWFGTYIYHPGLTPFHGVGVTSEITRAYDINYIPDPGPYGEIADIGIGPCGRYGFRNAYVSFSFEQYPVLPEWFRGNVEIREVSA